MEFQKCVFLALGIMYGISNLAKILLIIIKSNDRQSVTNTQFFLMSISIVGFLALQFNWLGL